MVLPWFDKTVSSQPIGDNHYRNFFIKLFRNNDRRIRTTLPYHASGKKIETIGRDNIIEVRQTLRQNLNGEVSPLTEVKISSLHKGGDA